MSADSSNYLTSRLDLKCHFVTALISPDHTECATHLLRQESCERDPYLTYALSRLGVRLKEVGRCIW